MPVLASLILPKTVEEREPLLIRFLKRLYAPVLRFTMRHKVAVLGFALAVMAIAFGVIAPNLGSEFVPKLSEGSIVINVVRLAGTDLEESIRYNTQMERILLEKFPDEVQYAWSRVGTAEVATDPMGVELTDLFLTLKPRTKWKRADTQEELTDQIKKELRDLPGPRLAITQPIEMRINEMISGVRSDVAAILYGDDFDTLVKKAAEVERVLKAIPGAADVTTEQITGQPVLEIRIKQDEIARYGVSAKTVLDLVESLGSKHVGEVYEGQFRFPLIIRLPEKLRADPEAVKSILIATPSGEQIPLTRLATVETVEGPNTIKREWYQRRITIEANVRGRDMGSFVALSGVAVLDDMLLVSTIRRLRRGGMDLEEAVENAAMTRLRPVLMTSLVAALGFVPMAFNTGMGAEVQRPLATVVIGGVFSATVMSLLVLRVLYLVFSGPVKVKKPVKVKTNDEQSTE
jgi:cobalt-zinc-cadmium resistance protein CzcA